MLVLFLRAEGSLPDWKEIGAVLKIYCSAISEGSWGFPAARPKNSSSPALQRLFLRAAEMTCRQEGSRIAMRGLCRQ